MAVDAIDQKTPEEVDLGVRIGTLKRDEKGNIIPTEVKFYIGPDLGVFSKLEDAQVAKQAYIETVGK